MIKYGFKKIIHNICEKRELKKKSKEISETKKNGCKDAKICRKKC
jgi:hypothetical protein